MPISPENSNRRNPRAPRALMGRPAVIPSPSCSAGQFFGAVGSKRRLRRSFWRLPARRVALGGRDPGAQSRELSHGCSGTSKKYRKPKDKGQQRFPPASENTKFREGHKSSFARPECDEPRRFRRRPGSAARDSAIGSRFGRSPRTPQQANPARYLARGQRRHRSCRGGSKWLDGPRP